MGPCLRRSGGPTAPRHAEQRALAPNKTDMASALINAARKRPRVFRRDVFPVTFRSVLGFMGGADNLIDPSNLRRLIEHNIPFLNIEDALIPVHVVTTNLGGAAVCLSSGPAVEALLASAAIPAAFPSVRIGKHYLIDGAVGSNTPILTAADLGATRIIVLPTGFACALHEPPKEQSRELYMR